jgi:hypothetical protein
VAYLIFGGDMLVMAFMIAVVVWISLRANDASIAAAARIPLEDERPARPVGAALAAIRHSAEERALPQEVDRRDA